MNNSNWSLSYYELWITIKAIYRKSPPKAENEAITFSDTQVSSTKQIANYFNRQFTTSKLGRHTSSRETQLVSREIKWNSLMSAVTFTTDQVITGICNCNNTKAVGLDRLSNVHLKNPGPNPIEYITAFFIDYVTSWRIPAIWKSYIVIHIPKPDKDSSLGTSYRPISLLCPAAKVMGLSFLPLSKHTCSQVLTNTDFDSDIQLLLLYYNWRVMSQHTSIKENRHIERSVSLLT